jgi:hypothetical protein
MQPTVLLLDPHAGEGDEQVRTRTRHAAMLTVRSGFNPQQAEADAGEACAGAQLLYVWPRTPPATAAAALKGALLALHGLMPSLVGQPVRTP